MKNPYKPLEFDKVAIAVVGLGYVGLPIAMEFAKKYKVLGFEIDSQRVKELNEGRDKTNEANVDDLKVLLDRSENRKYGLRLSSNVNELNQYNVYIVTVPTPIDEFKCPDLSPLKKASEMIGTVLKKNDLVIYESTVYPGCTEEVCVPVLEDSSKLKFNEDFFVGYSPERINPGDTVNTLTKIKKVTAGSTEEAADKVDQLYRTIITAGTFKAASIKVAEASKAIENAQRDLNISFFNELALIFDRLNIDTNDVIDAASTKWNFLKFKPGLVGGHCIGVDPYYLVSKAQTVGYHPNVILSGRRVNDTMGEFVANKVIKLMIKKGQIITNSRILILGFTFKENCPDVRNTGVVNIYKELIQFELDVDIFDPWASQTEVKHDYGISLLKNLDYDTRYDAIIVAVAHNEFLTLDFDRIKKDKTVIYDTKACIDRRLVDGRL